ncbi:MAG: transcription-repair coupling factor, partial [Acidobacteria bacterium]|nr:transcription-repair coupling factor [Acidobacteriota bacterium]
HIEAVGFELYTRMLEQAVRELKGEAAPEEEAIQLNLGLNIRIPADYIAEENQRLRIYKRIAGVENESQLADVGAELQDRYGEPPLAARNLLDYATLKLLAIRAGVTGIERKREQVSIHFRESANVHPERLMRFVAVESSAQFTPQGMLKFVLKSSRVEQVLGQLRNVLELLVGTPADEVRAD